MNNFEKIKAMGIEEMAVFFTKYTKWYGDKLLNEIGLINTPETPMQEFTIKRVKQEMKQWLESEDADNE